jgi:hypothetical protein
MHQHKPRVHDIERSHGQRIGCGVVLPDLQIRAPVHCHVAWIDVGGDHLSMRSDAVRHPAGDRAAARADLEAPSSVADAHRLEMSGRPRIEDRGERGEPVRRLRRGVVQ